MGNPFVQDLEKRVMLTVTLDVNGILTINSGNTSDEQFLVFDNGNTVLVQIPTQGVSSQFIKTSVLQININCGDGNDIVNVASTLTIPTLIIADDTTSATGDGNDNIQVGNGNDTIICGAGNDFVQDNGDDPTKQDSIDGGAGNDTISAGPGNDVIYGNFGNVTNPDNDTINGQGGNDSIFGDGGNDTLQGLDGNDTIQGGAGNDTMDGSVDFDFLDYSDHTGTAGRIWITFDLTANDGGLNAQGQVTENDSFMDADFEGVIGSSSTALGNVGNSNTVFVQSNVSEVIDGSLSGQALWIIGGPGVSYIIGSGAADTLDGGLGNDIIFAGDGGDSVLGGQGNDQISGEAGDDLLFGGTDVNDNPTVAADLSDDAISGGDGEDTIDGEGGNDFCAGGLGDDSFPQGTDPVLSGADILEGNEGLDTVDYSHRLGPIFVNIDGVANDGQVASGLIPAEGDLISDSTEVVLGTNFNDTMVATVDFIEDTITGALASHWFVGGAGNDSLLGAGGLDTLDAGIGNDTLDGGLAADFLDGGAGSDTLLYNTRTNDVNVTLNDTADDGEQNEFDDVRNVETVIAGSGNDNIDLSNVTVAVSIAGNAGNDTLLGGTGNDTLTGGNDDDSLSGGPGNDSLTGGQGSDIFDGGSGLDSLDYSAVTSPISVTFDNLANDGPAGENDNILDSIDIIIAGSGNDLISLVGVGIPHTLFGGGGNDTLVGGALNDYLDGGNGNDSIVGGGGNDVMYGQNGNDSISGDDGADRLVGGTGNDTLTGGDGNDTMVGGGGTNVMSGGTGNDMVSYYHETRNVSASLDGVPNDGIAGQHDDIRPDVERLQGGHGNDTLTGSGSSNVLDGGIDERILIDTRTNTYKNFTSGNDMLIGYNGNDTLRGGDGSDTLNGGTGNDVLDGGTGGDRLIGGNGIDTADYSARTANLRLSLDNVANDGEVGEFDKLDFDVEILLGGSGNDSIIGGPGNETLSGGVGNDTIRGSNGDDSIIGGAGLDSLFGDGGNDTIKADDGQADTINGGPGVDSVLKDVGLDVVTNVP